MRCNNRSLGIELQRRVMIWTEHLLRFLAFAWISYITVVERSICRTNCCLWSLLILLINVSTMSTKSARKVYVRVCACVHISVCEEMSCLFFIIGLQCTKITAIMFFLCLFSCWPIHCVNKYLLIVQHGVCVCVKVSV